MAEEGLSIGTISGSIELEDLVSPAMELIEKSLDKGIEAFKEFGGAIAGPVVGSIGAVTAAVGVLSTTILVLGEKGSTIKGVEDAFDRLAEQAGTTGNALRGALSEGVKSTVDDFDLMKGTMNLLSSGVKVTTDDFKLIGSVGREMGKAMGTDATQGVDTLSTALLTGRVRALSNLGIITDLKTGEENYAKSLGIAKDALDQAQKKEADRIEILRASQEWLNRVGESELSFKERIEQGHVAVDEWMDSLMKSVATSPIINTAIQGIGDAFQVAFGGKGEDAISGLMTLFEDFAIALTYIGQGAVEMGRVLYTNFQATKVVVLAVETAVLAFATTLAKVVEIAVQIEGKLHLVDPAEVARVTDTVDQLEAMRNSLAADTAEAARAAAGQSDFQKKLDDVSGSMASTRDKMEQLSKQHKETAEATEGHTKAVDEHEKAQQKLSKTAQGLIDAWTGEGKKILEVVSAFNALTPEQKASYDVQQALLPVIQKMIDGHHGVSQAMMEEYDAALQARDAAIQQDLERLRGMGITASYIDAQKAMGHSEEEIATKLGVSAKALSLYTGELKTHVDVIKLEASPKLEDFTNKLKDLGTAIPQKFFDDLGKVSSEIVNLEGHVQARAFGTDQIIDGVHTMVMSFEGMTEALRHVGIEVLKTDNELHNFAAYDFTGPVETLNDKLKYTEGITNAVTTALQQMGQSAGGVFGSMLIGATSIVNMLAKYLTQVDGVRGLSGKNTALGAASVGLGVVGQIGLSSNTTGGMIAGGAATGASIGMNPALVAATGGWSIAIGAAAGAIGGWVASMKEWRKVTADISRDFGNIHISEDLAKAIDDIEKQTGLGRTQASLTQLDKIIQEAGGLSTANLGMFTGKLHDTFSMIELGSMSVAQVTQILDKNFAQFAAAGTDSYGRLSSSIKEIITLNEKFGTNSQAVAQYLQQQGSAAEGAFNAITAGVLDVNGNMKVWDELKKKIADTGQGADELQAAAAAASGGLADLGVQAVASFAAAVAAGKSQSEALAAIHPGLVQLEHSYETLGLSVDDVALKQLMLRDKVVSANPQLINAVDGLSQEMVALDNMGLLNIQTFEAMERTGQTLYERLRGEVQNVMGADADLDEVNRQTLLQMQTYLQNAAHQAELLGIPLDDNTQKLVDQSKALGIWKEQGKSATDILTDGMKTLVQKVSDLIDALTGVQTHTQTTAAVTHTETRNMVHDWNDVHDSATEAAEGRSPSGIKQITVRTKEAQTAVEAAARSMVKNFGNIFVAATDASDAIYDTKKSVYDQIEAYRNAPNVVAHATQAQKDFIDEAIAAGVSVGDIAEVLGTTTTAVQLYVTQQEDAKRALEEANNVIDNYTTSQQDFIEKNYAGGMSLDDIAKKTGLSTKEVQKYIDAVKDAIAALDKLNQHQAGGGGGAAGAGGGGGGTTGPTDLIGPDEIHNLAVQALTAHGFEASVANLSALATAFGYHQGASVSRAAVVQFLQSQAALEAVTMHAVASPVHFAGGGLVQGSDTVPAMLTPQERVLSISQNEDYTRRMARDYENEASIDDMIAALHELRTDINMNLPRALGRAVGTAITPALAAQ